MNLESYSVSTYTWDRGKFFLHNTQIFDAQASVEGTQTIHSSPIYLFCPKISLNSFRIDILYLTARFFCLFYICKKKNPFVFHNEYDFFLEFYKHIYPWGYIPCSILTVIIIMFTQRTLKKFSFWTYIPWFNLKIMKNTLKNLPQV